MKIETIVSKVIVIGYLWNGTLGYTSYTLTEKEIAGMRSLGLGQITRKSVKEWLDKHPRDFREVKDFAITIGDGEFDSIFQEKESEWIYDELDDSCTWVYDLLNDL